MAKNASSTSLRDRFVGLSGPAKALLFVAIFAVIALTVTGIVIFGSPKGGVPITDGGSGTPAASGVASALASAATAPSTDASGTQTTPGAASAAGSAAGSSSKAAGKKSTTSKSGTTSGAGSSSSQESSQQAPPSKPPVLTAELRKKIAAEILEAEKRAEAEAAAKYPADPKKGGSVENSENYEQLRSDLIDTYTAAIVRKYGLTTEQTIDILILDAATTD